MRTQLYALALSAARTDEYGRIRIEMRAGWATASNDAEALGIAITLAKEKWPQTDGWFSYEGAIALYSTTDAIRRESNGP